MADSMLLAGTLSATINGQSYNVTGEGTYVPSSVTRETLTGQDGVHGFSEMPKAGKISWKGRDASTVSIAAINAMTNGTIVLQLANGKIIVGRNMWRAGDPIEVNTEDASFPIEMEGPSVTEN